MIPDIARVPDGHGIPKRILLDEGVKSLIIIPLVLHGRESGFIGLDTVRAVYRGSEDEVTLFRIIGELFSSVLERKWVGEALIEESFSLRD